MKNLKTIFLILVLTFLASINGQAQQKTKGKIATQANSTIANEDKDTLLNSSTSLRKGYQYYQVKSDNAASKQTQGATFGEKVNQGLHQAAGAISQGAAVQKDSTPIPSAERAINESGVSVKSTKPKK